MRVPSDVFEAIREWVGEGGPGRACMTRTPAGQKGAVEIRRTGDWRVQAPRSSFLSWVESFSGNWSSDQAVRRSNARADADPGRAV
jgi:hypothetical protein